MYNIFFKILILVIILSTIGILGLKPKMHKRIFVLDSSYSVVDDSSDYEEENIIPEKTTVEVVEKKISADKNIQTQKKDTVSKNINTQKKETPKKIEEKKAVVQNKPAKTVQKPQVVETVEKPKTVSKPVEIKKEIPKTTVQTKPVQSVMTEREEEIAWNIWRSNLQNQIMKDTKLPYIPKGIIFKFSFDVDKYGRITSIKTYSTNPNYTPYAIQYIAPVIRSYQGKEILDFPSGTQRLTTKFEGGWKISDSAKYSTPNDYNDIEKVKK